MAQPKCIKGYFRRKRYECLFGNKRGYRTRVSVLDFSRCNRAETGTPARTTFTFFLFWSVILPARHPMSVLCREVCKQSLWGVLSRLVCCTLLPNTPNAHNGLFGHNPFCSVFIYCQPCHNITFLICFFVIILFFLCYHSLAVFQNFIHRKPLRFFVLFETIMQFYHKLNLQFFVTSP